MEFNSCEIKKRDDAIERLEKDLMVVLANYNLFGVNVINVLTKLKTDLTMAQIQLKAAEDYIAVLRDEINTLNLKN